MLEGTFEELIDNVGGKEDATVVEKRSAGNETLSERSKRQAEIPADPEQDDTKLDDIVLTKYSILNIYVTSGLMFVSLRWK